jgi:hypothetical protein
MKIFNVFIFIISIFSCTNIISRNGLIFKADLRGTYDLPWSNIINQDKAGLKYFLIDTKLINNSETEKKFVSYSCTPIANIVADSKYVDFCVNNCSRNSLTTITLKPGQELQIPIIIQVKGENTDIQIRFGWILIENVNKNLDKYFEKSRNTLQNIIWSDPISIEIGKGQPYEIR